MKNGEIDHSFEPSRVLRLRRFRLALFLGALAWAPIIAAAVTLAQLKG